MSLVTVTSNSRTHAFSPNGDGFNDFFSLIVRGELTNLDMVIYNRWGEMIYQSTTLDTPWDGSYNGEAQPVGAYVYYLDWADTNGNAERYQGSFTLIR